MYIYVYIQKKSKPGNARWIQRKCDRHSSYYVLFPEIGTHFSVYLVATHATHVLQAQNRTNFQKVRITGIVFNKHSYRTAIFICVARTVYRPSQTVWIYILKKEKRKEEKPTRIGVELTCDTPYRIPSHNCVSLYLFIEASVP